MEIRIDVDTVRPPEGRVRRPDGAPIRFDGWLSLLAILERLAEKQPVDAGPPSSASGPSGATS